MLSLLDPSWWPLLGATTNAISALAKLLILSQVILSLQLPFAIVPLVMFTADKRKMGALVAPGWVTALAALIAVTVITSNLKLLWDFVAGL